MRTINVDRVIFWLMVVAVIDYAAAMVVLVSGPGWLAGVNFGLGVAASVAAVALPRIFPREDTVYDPVAREEMLIDALIVPDISPELKRALKDQEP
jgi:hypothetical protein